MLKHFVVLTSDGDFCGPFGCSIKDTLFHGFHVTGMQYLLHIENFPETKQRWQSDPNNEYTIALNIRLYNFANSLMTKNVSQITSYTSSEVWQYTADQRVATSTLRRYTYSVRLSTESPRPTPGSPRTRRIVEIHKEINETKSCHSS